MTDVLIVKHPYLEGRPVYEVPVIQEGDCYRPRIPQTQNFNWHAFYSPDNTKAYVAATPGLDKYLSKRRYATYFGLARYDPKGFLADASMEVSVDTA